LEFIPLQNPNPRSGFGEKSWPLSKSLTLKTAVLAEPSDRNSGRTSQNSKKNFLYKTHTCFAKKNSRPILCFLTNFEARYIQFED
jgi:hypothetical protein